MRPIDTIILHTAIIIKRKFCFTKNDVKEQNENKICRVCIQSSKLISIIGQFWNNKKTKYSKPQMTISNFPLTTASRINMPSKQPFLWKNTTRLAERFKRTCSNLYQKQTSTSTQWCNIKPLLFYILWISQLNAYGGKICASMRN